MYCTSTTHVAYKSISDVRDRYLIVCRTNAVWCMAGHMLGLGDRHGENILIDATSGDTVHVDFGCLFDRGLMLEVGDDVIT